MKRIIAALIGAAAAFSSTDSHALINGTTALSPLFPDAVRIVSPGSMCSATIVGPRVVLTAAHCATAQPTSFTYGDQRYRVTFGVSRDYSTRNHDLAIGVTDRPIQGARYATIDARTGVSRGETLALVGYGCTQPGGGAPSGTLRVGVTRVVGVGRGYIVSSMPEGSALCYGDSGGAAFAHRGGERVLVGVHSRGDIRATNIDVNLASSDSRAFLVRATQKLGVQICGVNAECPHVAL